MFIYKIDKIILFSIRPIHKFKYYGWLVISEACSIPDTSFAYVQRDHQFNFHKTKPF